ncbi:MAG: phenylalanine--tRNA ligase beta subunit-related protein [Chloroflexota bacterium]
MHLRIAEQVFAKHPEVVLGVVTVQGVDNSTIDPLIEEMLVGAVASLPERFGKVVPSQHPQIAPWREAYRRFGAKPKKYPSSIENLVKRVLKGQTIAPINNLVAAYNTVSLNHLLPVGGEDLDKIEGGVWLTAAGADEAPVQLLGEREARPPYPNEIIYKDDVGTICRRWNWKEADRTKLTPETRNAFFVIEAIPPISEDAVWKAATDLSGIIGLYCGGRVRTMILNRQNPSCLLEAPPLFLSDDAEAL